jgi:hypothetical protein
MEDVSANNTTSGVKSFLRKYVQPEVGSDKLTPLHGNVPEFTCTCLDFEIVFKYC